MLTNIFSQLLNNLCQVLDIRYDNLELLSPSPSPARPTGPPGGRQLNIRTDPFDLSALGSTASWDTAATARGPAQLQSPLGAGRPVDSFGFPSSAPSAPSPMAAFAPSQPTGLGAPGYGLGGAAPLGQTPINPYASMPSPGQQRPMSAYGAPSPVRATGYGYGQAGAGGGAPQDPFADLVNMKRP